ncbi:MAG: WecB/TagA/CpsF family glycosyltransferase [Candidatus Eremiobacteraeota bacterium]|nr:WecB/TagA/CpsF family glycosyltransferase [Candidatus Eremiobacteraeota bacterium]
MMTTDLPVYRALGVKFHPVTMEDAVARIGQYIATGGFHLVVTLGTEMIMRALEDHGFFETVERADLVVPDGIGLVLASRYCGLEAPERVAGIDLVTQLFERLPVETRYFLLGAAPGIAAAAAEELRRRYPTAQIVGVQDGFFQDEEAVLAMIDAADPDVLLVGMGSPRQEIWLERHRERLRARIGIGVGGSFDVLSGQLERAPRWVIRLHSEWLYRLLRQPSRWLRMMALPRFVTRVMVSRGRAVVVEKEST